MTKNRGIVLFLIAMLSIFLTACGAVGSSSPTENVSTDNPPVSTGNVHGSSGPNCVTGNIQVTGSTALQPLARAVAMRYQQKCPGSNITIGGGGSSTGLKNVQDSSATIGNSDVFANKSLYPNLVDNQVAVVSFSVVVNGKVASVKDLTSAELKGIYSGRTKNWKELGGPDLPIVPVSRPAGSGTRLTFEQYILGSKETVTGNPVANASGEVATTIDQTDGAVSYIATDFARKNNLNIVKLNGVAETNEHVQDNSYTFWNIEHMYTKGPATGLALAYIDYIKSPLNASLRQEQGFLDITRMSPKALATRNPPS